VGYILGQDVAPTGQTDWVSGLEIIALIRGAGDGDHEMVITIRKRIDSITV
jgi:hypothetical protein